MNPEPGPPRRKSLLISVGGVAIGVMLLFSNFVEEGDRRLLPRAFSGDCYSADGLPISRVNCMLGLNKKKKTTPPRRKARRTKPPKRSKPIVNAPSSSRQSPSGLTDEDISGASAHIAARLASEEGQALKKDIEQWRQAPDDPYKLCRRLSKLLRPVTRNLLLPELKDLNHKARAVVAEGSTQRCDGLKKEWLVWLDKNRVWLETPSGVSAMFSSGHTKGREMMEVPDLTESEISGFKGVGEAFKFDNDGGESLILKVSAASLPKAQPLEKLGLVYRHQRMSKCGNAGPEPVNVYTARPFFFEGDAAYFYLEGISQHRHMQLISLDTASSETSWLSEEVVVF